VADQLAPQLAFEGFTEQLAGHGIGLAHHTAAIEHDDATGEQIQQVLQPPGQTGLFGQFAVALGIDLKQLRLQLRHLLFQQAMRLTLLISHLVVQTIGLFELFTVLRILPQVWSSDRHRNPLINTRLERSNERAMLLYKKPFKSNSYD